MLLIECEKQLRSVVKKLNPELKFSMASLNEINATDQSGLRVRAAFLEAMELVAMTDETYAKNFPEGCFVHYAEMVKWGYYPGGILPYGRFVIYTSNF